MLLKTLKGVGLSPVPSYADLMDAAANSLDFSTTKGGAVFWSGGNMKAAQAWASSTGRTTLEQTAGGNYLVSLDLFANLKPHEAAAIWDVASQRFADGASGQLHVFSTKAKMMSPYTGLPRTWWRIEKPALLRNPNVTGVTRMKIDGTPAKNGHLVKGCK